MTELSPTPPESHRLQPDHLPTPFSATEIREASHPGMSVAFRIDRPGTEPYLDRWEFLSGDADGGERRRWSETVDGVLREEPATARSSWLDLQRHASYPAATTAVTRRRVTIGLGEFDCWLYTTHGDDGSITRAAFAIDLPGPPVSLVTEVDGDSVFRMELVEVVPPG